MLQVLLQDVTLCYKLKQYKCFNFDLNQIRCLRFDQFDGGKMRKPYIMLAGLSLISGSAFATPGLPNTLQQQEQALLKANPAMSKKALDSALIAYAHLRQQGKDSQQILSFINYVKPDNQKRLWVVNMRNTQVVYNTYVAQGKNTGLVKASHFSNKVGSLASSIGVFLTGKTYIDRHGTALFLHGLDQGFNDNAYKRHVIIHGAWYATPQFVKRYHRVGRSWGCPALGKKIEPKVVNTIKDGTVLVSYYPNQKWLSNSEYEQPLAT